MYRKMEKYGKIILVIVMLNFIVCEDDKTLRKTEVEEITKFMMNYDIDYKIYEFNEYDNSFYSCVNKEENFKIYLLDIVTAKSSGVDAARKIREEYDDWSSVIMIITSHPEYKYEALTSRLFLLDFINKLNNMENKLQENLNIAMKHYNKRQKQLRFLYNRNYYNIELRDIVCIEKEPDSKRCIISTKYGKEIIPGTLDSIYKKLDNRFIKTHKSLIVNLDEVRKFDISNNKITFKNGETTYLVSRNKKKELINYVSNVN